MEDGDPQNQWSKEGVKAHVCDEYLHIMYLYVMKEVEANSRDH